MRNVIFTRQILEWEHKDGPGLMIISRGKNEEGQFIVARQGYAPDAAAKRQLLIRLNAACQKDEEHINKGFGQPVPPLSLSIRLRLKLDRALGRILQWLNYPKAAN